MARSDTGVGSGAGSPTAPSTTKTASSTVKQNNEQALGIDTLARGTLIAAALCVFMAQFALTVPAGLNGLFQQDFHTSASELTWITDAFLVPVTVLELTFGLLGDMFGRRRLLVGGSVLVAVGFVVCVLTPGPEAGHGTRLAVLWTGQIIAGIGAAAVIPTTLAMIAAGTHTPRARARSISVWAAALSMGSVLSPLACGLVAQSQFGSWPNSGWRWAFLVVVVLAAVSAVLAFVLAKDSKSPEGRSLDWPGQITIAVAAVALLFAVIQGPTSGWASIEVIGGFVVAAVFLVAFVLAERRSASPLLQLDLFANRNFTVAAIVTVVGMFCYLGTGYVTSIRLTAIQGFTPLKASLAFIVFNGVSALIQVPIASRLIERYDPKWVLGGGLLLLGAGDFWMASIPIGHQSVTPLIAPLVVAGAGVAFVLSAVTAVVINTVPHNLAGMAAGWTSLLRDFGFTLGPAVVGAIALSRAAHEISDKVASDPALGQALDTFNASAATAPDAQRETVEGAIAAVNSGPLGANAVPETVALPDGSTVPFNPLKDTAFQALGNAYSLGYLIVGLCAIAAAVVTVVLIKGDRPDTPVTAEAADA
ncbi:MFS transporter [Streptomyces caelestis]|jgi:MFS family permease|uniref:MFS family permease n=1 Tax=Streptomyces caelestis TaxID=36816 RepID=A0A7W9GZM6_9ACTN|nr:MFS transporter [Streptomyces caelestis]MBB5792683.1 MFS family permease [Streptomyces caelestis]GGW86898.1 MFS transporter [Streptomyces caelestis]